MATLAGIKILARMILATYPESKLNLADEPDAKIWAMIFKNIDDAVLYEAFSEYVRRGNKFPPNAGDIAAMCNELVGKQTRMVQLSGVVRESLQEAKTYIEKMRALPDGTNPMS